MSTAAKTTQRSVEGGDAQGKKNVNMEYMEQQIIWPEWSDAELNTEKWDYAKVPDKTKGKTSAKSGSITTVDSTIVDDIDSEGQYCDPYLVQLPSSLTTSGGGRSDVCWVRPVTLNPGAKIVIYKTDASSNIFPDLISANRHILHSQLVRRFISAMYTLIYLGNSHPFAVEWATALFTPNTSMSVGEQQSTAWKPWHHVYAMCRSGKDQPHLPLVNPSGKYIVRLYWMGCWRKITLDDKIPVDSENSHVLVPLTVTSAAAVAAAAEIELWPVLLMKALMKIASLTWQPDKEIVDFDIITCFTGWVSQKVKTKDVDLDDVWEIVHNYSDKFAWEQKVRQSKSQQSSKKIGKKASGVTEISSKKGGSTKTSAKSDKSSKTLKGQKSTPVFKEPSLFHLIATCSDLRNSDQNLVQNLSPCWDHDFLIDQTRNIPLVEKIIDPSKELAPWKQYRWVDWAIDQGIWEREEIEQNIKCLKVISNLRQFVDNPDTTVNDEIVATSVKIVDDRADLPKQTKKEKKGKKDKSSKKSGSSKERKSKTQLQFIDPSVWCDFHKLGPHLTSITIYFKPSSFSTNIVLSNIPFNTTVDTKSVKKVTRKEEKRNKIDAAMPSSESTIKYIHWAGGMSTECNIAPVYLFTDSIDMKLLLFSVAVVGNDFPLPEIKQQIDLEPNRSICKKYVCKLGKCVSECICQNTNVEQINLQIENFVDTRKITYLKLSNYTWNNRETSGPFMTMESYGTKNVLLELDKGRQVQKLNIESEKPFVLILLSETDLTVGKVDEILDAMVSESQLLTKACYHICTAFGNLVKNFGTPEYINSLREFYKSYGVKEGLSKANMVNIHACFFEELVKIMVELFPEEQYYNLSRAIRVLFLNPQFRITETQLKKSKMPFEEVKIETNDECKCDDIDGIKVKEESAIKLQAYFRMIHVRKLKLMHDPSHKNFISIVETLKNIYMAIFSNKSRNTVCINLLRNFINNGKLIDVKQHLPYYKDLNSVIWFMKFSGEIKHAGLYTWVPIVRQIFFLETSEDIFIRVYLLCDLKDYMLRIFNNDTEDEIDRCENKALVGKYKKNEKGYIIFAYGKTQDFPLNNMQWKLYIVTNKTVIPYQIKATQSIITSNQLKENYIPNLDKLVCRCSLKIKQTCMVSLRFNVSTDNVKIKLQCLNKMGEILYETIDISPVLMLVLIFETNESNISLVTNNLIASDSSRSDVKSITSIKKSAKSRINSDKRSVQSRSSIKSKRKHSVTSINYCVTEYIIQAFVLDDSWPLSFTEWTLVEKLRTRNSIENELLASSTDQPGKSIHAIPSSRRTIISKRSKDKSGNSNINQFEKPYWCLTTVYDVGNNVQVDIDDSRNEEIKMIKRDCFGRDPDRLRRGKQLRKDFLEQNYEKFLASEDMSTGAIRFDSISKKSSYESEKSCASLHFPSEWSKLPFDEDTLFLDSPLQWIVSQTFAGELKDIERKHMSSESKEKILNDICTRTGIWEEHNTYYLNNIQEFIEDWKKLNTQLKEKYDGVQKETVNIWKEYDKDREQFVDKGDKAKKNKSKEKTKETTKKKKK